MCLVVTIHCTSTEDMGLMILQNLNITVYYIDVPNALKCDKILCTINSSKINCMLGGNSSLLTQKSSYVDGIEKFRGFFINFLICFKIWPKTISAFVRRNKQGRSWNSVDGRGCGCVQFLTYLGIFLVKCCLGSATP